MEKIAAFFDIDGTLYREGLITSMFKKLVKSDIIDSQRWYKEVKEKYNKWDQRVGNYDDYLLKVAEIYTEAIRGLHRSQIEFIAQKVVAQKGDRVYMYTRDRMAWHQQQGHQLIIISGSPSELVLAMSRKHGADLAVGSRYHLDEHECYTGEVTPMWDSLSKKKAMNCFVEEQGICLAKSYAYGDTAGDFLMLKQVGQPVAMNPTKELIHLILKDKEIKQKTKVVVERKDMIYHLTPEILMILESNS